MVETERDGIMNRTVAAVVTKKKLKKAWWSGGLEVVSQNMKVES